MVAEIAMKSMSYEMVSPITAAVVLGSTPYCRQEAGDINPQSCGNPHTELPISAAEVGQLAVNDRLALGTGNPLHRHHDVVNQVLSVSLGQHVAEEIPRLCIVIIFARSVVVVPVSNRRFQGKRWLFVMRVDRHVIEAVRPVVRAAAAVAVGSHEPIALIIGYDEGALVDRKLFIVDPQTVTVCVGV